MNSGFRAPTLTELYRQFSVGAITTRPNDLLAPERLIGGELGVNIAPAKNVSLRLTWFDNQLTNPVLNVTLNATTAQKQNVPETRVRGVQTDVDYRLGTAWRFSAGYVYDDATVTDAGVNTGAAREAAAAGVEEPRHGAGAYTNDKIATIAFSMQIVGLTYNDDLNVNFIPVPTLTEAGYSGSYPAGLPGYVVVGPERVAHLQPQPSGVRRRAEPVRQGLFRPDQPVDDRHAAPGQRRGQDSLLGTIRRNRGDRRDR